MKALQKNQGRTDQILGAMADMLTSLALPSQEWISESSEECPLVDEQRRGVDLVHWGPTGLDPGRGIQDHPTKSWRSGEVTSYAPPLRPATSVTASLVHSGAVRGG
ncbi:hypothetical protein ANANG_G00252510 [Anguilla anguilla]|uniref:Uncharacterized protein n=1 Tax=Anguilla anguilla TaxID=7936 RepID=A0A9D3M0N9_ANGAN|nr:hypothetical protein ANANG_G00252510 [Anguilla anguilla]